MLYKYCIIKLKKILYAMKRKFNFFFLLFSLVNYSFLDLLDNWPIRSCKYIYSSIWNIRVHKMARAFVINTSERREAEKSNAPADDITHKSVATLLIVTYMLLRNGGRKKNKKWRFRFSLQIRLGKRNDPHFAIGTLIEARLYPMRKNARGRSSRTKKGIRKGADWSVTIAIKQENQS